MKLEKEDILYDFDDLMLFFCGDFTPKEIKTLEKMRNKNVKLTLEAEDIILDDIEKKYLSGVIRPFRDEIEYIKKCNFTDEYEYLAFYMKKQPAFTLANFKEGTMYKGMELNKEYTLEELGL